jgi:phosphoribosylglycinamide formyltransferase-1
MVNGKVRIAFLVSGEGGNLKFICNVVDRGILENCQICGTIADRECGAAKFAESRMPVSQCPAGEKQATALKKAIDTLNPDLIISGLHRLIPAEIVRTYPRKIINLHYSLLPSFGGRGMIGDKPVWAALKHGCTIVGTTVHFINEELDAGEIIAQTAINVIPGEPFGEVMQRIFQSGCKNLAYSISAITPVRLTEKEDLWF